MKKVLLVATALMIGGMFNLVKAQDNHDDVHTINFTIPSVTLLDIESAGSTTLTFTATAPTEAGDSLTFPSTDNSLWLNYTSIKATSTTTRKITAVLDIAAPANTTLKVTAATATTGFGGRGTTAGQVSLSTTAASVITGITSCYTLDGDSKGSQLTYQWNRTGTANYGNLNADTDPVEVTYTLQDN
ncbi:MAG TPA: hypothetical protein P5550_09020 [Bacteroidales bacterium]|nr:hypothetical protein [Bacteroidales bacterium]HRZ76866.1 hypothetical protein [Bacteroidales bacterium]